MPEIRVRIDTQKFTSEALKKVCKTAIGKPVTYEGKKVGEVTNAEFIEGRIVLILAITIKVPSLEP